MVGASCSKWIACSPMRNGGGGRPLNSVVRHLRMKRRREVLTYPLNKQQIHDELSHFVEYFSSKGLGSCSVLFGSGWGNDYYPGKIWPREDIPLADLVAKVRHVEASGIGALGTDDLFLELPEIEFLFCNDSDVHIFFDATNADVEFFYQRWKQLRYNPAEWLKDPEKRGPGTKVRMN